MGTARGTVLVAHLRNHVLTLLLLYQAGYSVGRYISLEQIVERTPGELLRHPVSVLSRAGTRDSTRYSPGGNTFSALSSQLTGNLSSVLV